MNSSIEPEDSERDLIFGGMKGRGLIALFEMRSMEFSMNLDSIIRVSFLIRNYSYVAVFF